MSTPSFRSFPATPSTIDVGVSPSTPFSVKDSVVLITGGGSGLGLSFTELFIKAGAKTVIITGRRENVLKEAQNKYPDHIVYYVSDAGSADDRVKVFQKVSKDYPNLNILLNNAGIQNRVPLSADHREWKETAEEIEINLSAPIHYSQLFTPLLLSQKKESAIIHVTSGLAFVAFPPAPLYSATKFGLHSFILSQRYSFQGTTVRIVEFVPPATRSNLGGSHAFGEDCDEVCKSMFDRFIGGELEMGYKFSEIARTATRDKLHNMMVGVGKVMPIPPFKQ